MWCVWPPLQQVYEQRPLAFVQIFLAIFAAEVWGNKQQEKSPLGGDLGWDPLGLKCVWCWLDSFSK